MKVLKKDNKDIKFVIFNKEIKHAQLQEFRITSYFGALVYITKMYDKSLAAH